MVQDLSSTNVDVYCSRHTHHQ